MRLLPSDPDIQTIVARIRSHDIDLQPDFQRGEVWGQSKQVRLIDSILRDWHVPPIHVIEHTESATQDVLDGQQRLVAIRDFVDGLIKVDGTVPPHDADIEKLDGLRYSQLPPNWKRKFDQFTIRIFRIVDFKPDEPFELFFRLNQPVALTSAEQRNAFFGPVRSQVKELTQSLSSVSFGFSNSRMALDDVLARVCLSVENRTISTKITAAKLTDRYRAKEDFSSETMAICNSAVDNLVLSKNFWDRPVKLNKATLFSFLWLSACATRHYRDATPMLLGDTISSVEVFRTGKLQDLESQRFVFPPNIALEGEHLSSLVRMFLDRSASRVSDVSSVIARDVFLWIILGVSQLNAGYQTVSTVPYLETLSVVLKEYLRQQPDPDATIITPLIETLLWGELL